MTNDAVYRALMNNGIPATVADWLATLDQTIDDLRRRVAVLEAADAARAKEKP